MSKLNKRDKVFWGAVPQTQHDEYMPRAYILRATIGVLGLFLPIILCVGGFAIQTGFPYSMSHFYYTVYGDFFVATCFAIGIALITLRGFDVVDLWANRVAGIGVLIVALFPTGQIGYETTYPTGIEGKSNSIHFVGAVVFMVTSAFICIWNFTKQSPKPDPFRIRARNGRENKFYVSCGLIIATCILILVFVGLETPPVQSETPSMFFVAEAIAVGIFALAWLRKGRVILFPA